MVAKGTSGCEPNCTIQADVTAVGITNAAGQAPAKGDALKVSLTVRNGPGGTCEVYWGITKVTQKDLLDRSVQKLEKLIRDVGGVQNVNEENMPEAHIRGDVNTQYKCIGAAIITMQQAGFQRVGFISEPPPLTGYRAE